jgi:hypothetical protein
VLWLGFWGFAPGYDSAGLQRAWACGCCLLRVRLYTSGVARVRVFGLGCGLRWRAAAVGVCVALGLGGAAAAQEDEGKVPTLHAYTNLVQVPTLVLDQDRKPIMPIAEGRFLISLDGGPKFRVTHARLEGDDAITLAILLDVSQPFPNLMRGIDEAIAGLAPDSLHAKDHVSVYSLDCKLVRTAGDVPVDAAMLKDAVGRALEAWRTHGQDRHSRSCKVSWNLWDAMGHVTQGLKGQPGRRVMLVVTDGVDRGSRSSWDALRDYAQENGVAIFGLVQPGDLSGLFRTAAPGQATGFNPLCELTGGIVLTSTQKELAERLKWFTTLLRDRYIVEFPHPIDTNGGEHDMNITVDKMDAFIRPAGIGIPLDDPAILKDPTTVPSDPSRAPQLGKRKPPAPH